MKCVHSLMKQILCFSYSIVLICAMLLGLPLVFCIVVLEVVICCFCVLAFYAQLYELIDSKPFNTIPYIAIHKCITVQSKTDKHSNLKFNYLRYNSRQ